MAQKNKGIFITIEGIEGVGKSTAIHFLEEYFNSHHREFILTREPGGTEIAEAIRKLLLHHYQESMSTDTELLLLFASRAQHIAKIIQPALAAGKIVVSDRFTDATYAYQGGGRGVSIERVTALEELVQGDLQPDLTVLLDAPIEIGLQRILTRGVKDRIEQEKIEFFHRVREGYLKRAEKYPKRFKIIDATQSVLQVQTILRQVLSNLLLEKNSMVSQGAN